MARCLAVCVCVCVCVWFSLAVDDIPVLCEGADTVPHERVVSSSDEPQDKNSEQEGGREGGR